MTLRPLPNPSGPEPNPYKTLPPSTNPSRHARMDGSPHVTHDLGCLPFPRPQGLTMICPESVSSHAWTSHAHPKPSAWLRPVSRGNRHFTVGDGRLLQSGPRPEGRLLRQPALEGLTRSARMDSPRQVGRNNFRRSKAAAAAFEERKGAAAFDARVLVCVKCFMI
ncbi:hypothetical protein F511_36688 [Dorcoceras hygrometricum]|uniref:Uncharacterized protein n=1 Tax=Dorcoceras hygrometricum TaxID=472368 RepID=A0A2Z7C5E8_9LAMI|nr:hypothetical protein F511_36688 [Dorcoceras hygrometricum]